MKAIVLMFDSLNKRFLPGFSKNALNLPGFQRLYEHTVAFQNAYAGSLPCMPARKELHTGRLNFLHQAWNPMDPYDNSMPEILQKNGIHSHIITDHYHYLQDGGAGYLTRYQTWEAARGQEGDPWKCSLRKTTVNHCFGENLYNFGKTPDAKEARRHQDEINRQWEKRNNEIPLVKTMEKGLQFLDENHKYDNWFLQLENFDPHEPFFVPDEYLVKYADNDVEFPFDWPPYAPVKEDYEFVGKIRKKYIALLHFIDDQLTLFLDKMDEYDLWRDTLLIVNTDHGYLLGEHKWWAKNVMPVYQEIANIPMYVWSPAIQKRNLKSNALVQTIDIAPTILNYFKLPVPEEMQGENLLHTLAEDKSLRKYALFGYFGKHVNITDGRYVYMKSPVSKNNEPLYEYTLNPARMDRRFPVEKIHSSELSEGFRFTKGCKVLKISAAQMDNSEFSAYSYGNRLYDLQKDPLQTETIHDKRIEEIMKREMIRLMKENDAPKEQYIRLGLEL